MEALFLTLSGLMKSYTSGAEAVSVLNGVDAQVPRGQSVVITGDSGCGKTTLLHLIAAMDTPTKGTIVVDGLDLAKASEAELGLYRNKTIGLIFQFHFLLKEFTALENVMMPCRMGGMSTKASKERGLALLEEVGISHRASHYPSQLSGGERQRVALARALSNDPPLVLADEPTGNLDEKNAALVEELLFNLAKRHGKTLLLVTHNTQIAKDGDLHWHLRGGVMVQEVSP